MLRHKEFSGSYPLFGKSTTAAEALEKWVNENKIPHNRIVAINRDFDGCACLWYWEHQQSPEEKRMLDATAEALKIRQAVAKVCLKPGDPCDPEGVFNE